MVLTRVMVLVCVMVLARVLVLAHVMVLARVMVFAVSSPLDKGPTASAPEGREGQSQEVLHLEVGAQIGVDDVHSS